MKVRVVKVPVLEVPALTVRTLTVLMPVTLLMLMLVVLPTPVLQHRPEHRPEPAVPPATFLAASDTINGERITDRALVQRIERIAAGVPSSLLASHSRAAPVRYLAQGFGAGDDAPVFQGVFRDPAAALAFGCALDVDIGDHCEITPVAVATATYEEVPGVRCVPLSFALGAPAFEPDRCEAGG